MYKLTESYLIYPQHMTGAAKKWLIHWPDYSNLPVDPQLLHT